jgi:hypothetical protein
MLAKLVPEVKSTVTRRDLTVLLSKIKRAGMVLNDPAIAQFGLKGVIASSLLDELKEGTPTRKLIQTLLNIGCVEINPGPKPLYHSRVKMPIKCDRCGVYGHKARGCAMTPALRKTLPDVLRGGEYDAFAESESEAEMAPEANCCTSSSNGEKEKEGGSTHPVVKKVEKPVVVEAPKPPPQPLDGYRLSITAADQYLLETHGTIPLSGLEPRPRAKTLSMRHRVVAPSSSVALSNLHCDKVDQPIVLVDWTYSYQPELTYLDRIVGYFVGGLAEPEVRTVIYSPHLVTCALREYPLDTNIDIARDSARGMITRITSVKLDDRLDAAVLAGSELVLQVAITEGSLNSMWVPDAGLSGTPWYGTGLNEAFQEGWERTPKFTQLDIAPWRPTCHDPNPYYWRRRMYLKLARGLGALLTSVVLILALYLAMPRFLVTAVTLTLYGVVWVSGCFVTFLWRNPGYLVHLSGLCVAGCMTICGLSRFRRLMNGSRRRLTQVVVV